MAKLEVNVEVVRTKWYYVTKIFYLIGLRRMALKVIQNKKIVKVGKVG